MPILMNGKRPSARAIMPQPGADSQPVLYALGYGCDEIETLVSTGDVGIT